MVNKDVYIISTDKTCSIFIVCRPIFSEVLQKNNFYQCACTLEALFAKGHSVCLSVCHIRDSRLND